MQTLLLARVCNKETKRPEHPKRKRFTNAKNILKRQLYNGVQLQNK